MLGLDFDPSALTFVPTDARNPYGIIAEALIQFIAKYERVPTLDEVYDLKDDTVALLPDKGLTASVVKDSLSRTFDVVAETAAKYAGQDDDMRQPMLDRLTVNIGNRKLRRQVEEITDLIGRNDYDRAREALKDIGTDAPATAEAPLIINAGDAWNFGEVEWVVDGLIPKRGLMFVGAVAKTGKSLKLHYLSYAITCGRPFVFGTATFTVKDSKARILYISEEEDGPIIQDRRRDLLRPYGLNVVPNDRFSLMVKAGVDILDDAWITRLADICNREDRRVLILDTYEAVTPSANPKEIGDHKKALLNLRALADAINGVVIVADHSKLPPRDGPVRTLLSHNDLAWSSLKGQRADHFLMMAETPEEGRFECFMGGRLTGDKRRFLLARSPKGSAVEKFRFAGSFDPINAARQGRRAGRQLAVESALRTSGEWMTRAEVQEEVGGGRNQVGDILTVLLTEGKVEVRGGENSPTRAYRWLLAPEAVSASEASNP